MKTKRFTLGAVLAVAAGASLHVHADTITCHFTEPYITLVHDTAEASLEVSGLNREKEQFAGIGLRLTGVNTFELRWADSWLSLTLDYRGGDMMSDHIYPISARYGGNDDTSRFLSGGCSSEELDVIVPVDA